MVFGWIILATVTATFLFMIISAIYDRLKKRPILEYPFISFLIPTYKDGDSIKNTIKTIYKSYKKGKFEVIVVNDCSPDNTLQILKELKKKYPMKILSNKKNMGKVASVNKAIDASRGKVCFVIDSDILLNKKAVEECISRLEDDKIKAVSCRYMPITKGPFSLMQSFEYGFLYFTAAPHNLTSSLFIWGGCIAIKRDILLKVGKFSLNSICEDTDLAMKIRALGYKVQQCYTSVFTHVPQTPREWFHQKIRWTGGTVQNAITHWRTMFSNPVTLFFILSMILVIIAFIVTAILNIVEIAQFFVSFEFFYTVSLSSVTAVTIAALGGAIGILQAVGFMLLGTIMHIPSVIIGHQKIIRDPHHILWVIPFAIIYMPVYGFVSFLGFLWGIKKYHQLKHGGRGW